jgi:hypothetical protein
LFLYNGVRYSDETQREVRLIPWLRYDNRVDFNYFFAGAELAWHGDAADLYPYPGEATFYQFDPIFGVVEDEYANARLLARGNYYNPPALAYLESPLTTLPFRFAFWLFCGLGVACLGAMIAIGWKNGTRIVEMPLVALGILAFKPVHEAIIMGHITLFFLLALTIGFFLLRAQKPVLAGLVFSLLALKPQWAILPALFLLMRGEWRALGTMAVAASLIFFVPFFVTGFETLSNYIRFLRYSASLDIKDAPHMFSWNGFFSKLDGSEIQNGQLVPFADAPPPLLIYGLIGVTIGLLLVVWAGRDYYLSVAATIVAMLLVSTHSVWYDWALLAVAAVFLTLRAPQSSRWQRVETWVVMLAVYLAASQSIAELLKPERHVIDWHRPAFYSMTLVAFGSLAWMASVVVRQGEWRFGLADLTLLRRRA